SQATEVPMPGEPETWVGKVLSGELEVEEELGAGGMGFVYLARERRTGQKVVVKAPREDNPDPDLLARFRREVKALMQLPHPHVVKILGMGEHEGMPFAVLPFLEGGSLSKRHPLGRDGRPRPVEPHSLAAWLGAVAEALDFIHAKGYLHRD